MGRGSAALPPCTASLPRPGQRPGRFVSSHPFRMAASRRTRCRAATPASRSLGCRSSRGWRTSCRPRRLRRGCSGSRGGRCDQGPRSCDPPPCAILPGKRRCRMRRGGGGRGGRGGATGAEGPDEGGRRPRASRPLPSGPEKLDQRLRCRFSKGVSRSQHRPEWSSHRRTAGLRGKHIKEGRGRTTETDDPSTTYPPGQQEFKAAGSEGGPSAS